MRYLFIIALVFMLDSCCSNRCLVENTITEEKIVQEVVRDTVYIVSADSSNFTSDLIIDSSNQIYISNPIVKSGKRLSAPIVKIANNKLSVDCTSEAQKLFKQWKERHVFQQKSKTKNVLKYVEKQLSQWQIFQIWLGRLALIAAIILLILFFFKLKF